VTAPGGGASDTHRRPRAGGAHTEPAVRRSQHGPGVRGMSWRFASVTFNVKSERSAMNSNWLVQVVQWSVWGFAVTSVLGWVARSRHRARPDGDARRLAHPPSTLVIGILGIAIFGGAAIASNMWPNETVSVWTTLTFVGLALLSVPVLADYFFARHELSEEGMQYGRMTGQRGSFRWSEVSRVRYAMKMGWFKLELKSGASVRVSAMLMGLPEFASLVLSHVPATVIDEPTRAVLEATAAGNPPNLWG
jgi:hypothetical protein